MRSRLSGVAVVAVSGLAQCASGDVLASTSFEKGSIAEPFDDSGDILATGGGLMLLGAGRNEPTTGDGGVTSGEWGFNTRWSDTRNASDSGQPSPLDRDNSIDPEDLMGVTDFTASGAPNGYLDGSRGYRFNDGDGETRLDMRTVDTAGMTKRVLELGIWINRTSWESNDVFSVFVGDGLITLPLLIFDRTMLSGLSSPDIEPAIWRTQSLEIPEFVGEKLMISIRMDHNTDTENVFVDRLTLTGVPAPGGAVVMLLGCAGLARRSRRRAGGQHVPRAEVSNQFSR